MMSRIALPAVGGRASRLLGDERERRRLVEQPQLAPRGLAVGGIEEDAAREQVAVEVGHQRSHVAGVLGRDPAPGPFLKAAQARCTPVRPAVQLLSFTL